MRSILPFTLLIGSTFLFSAGGCNSDEVKKQPVASAIQDSTNILFTISGLDGPEAVRYNPAESVYYISNFTGGGMERDANGFITKASDTGEILDLKFMTLSDGEHPLHAPRGMYLNEEGLWVADIDGVHLFNTGSGDQERFYDFSEFETGFLNDVTGNSSGDIFISDTGTNTVFRISGDEVSVYRDSLSVSPNGIFYHAADTSLYLAPWRGVTSFLKLNSSGKAMQTAELKGGNFDGVEYHNGRWILSSQADSAIIAVNPDNDSAEVIISTPGRGADIGINTDKQHIAVPYIAKNRVDIWNLEQ